MIFGALFVEFIRISWGPALLDLVSRVHHIDTHAARLRARRLRRRPAARALRRAGGRSRALAGARLTPCRASRIHATRIVGPQTTPQVTPQQGERRMRKTFLLLAAALAVSAVVVRDGRCDVVGDAGRYGEVDPARGHVPAQRAGVGLRADPGRHGRVLLVRQRARRRQRPQDQLQVRGRRLQPGEHRADHAQVRRAGPRVRARRRARDRAADCGAPVPERQQGAAAVRLDRRDDVRP